MKSTVICLLLALTVYQIAATFTVKYTCDENNGFTFKAYGTSAVKKVYVKDKMDSCSTTVTTGANLRGFTASAGTSGSPTTGEITNSASDIAACGDEDTATDVRKLTLYLQTNVNTLQGSDGVVTITCSTADGNKGEQKLTAATISGDPSGTVTTEIDMDLKVKLLPSNTEDGQLVTADSAEAAQIGQEYFIVGVLSTPTSSTVKTFLLHTCTAMPDVGTDPSIKVINGVGCPDKTDGVYLVDTEEPSEVTVSEKFVLKWPVFKIFQINGHDKVQFVCQIKACANGDDRCKAPENCPNAKRRRRDTHSGADYHNATVKTTLIVTLPSSGHGQVGTSQQELSIGSCLSHVSFISVVAILAVLLVVSLAVSVFFCSKLIRQNNNSQQKEAYPNPAYKA